MAAGLDDRKTREAFLVGFRFDPRYIADTVHERRAAYLRDIESSSDPEIKKLRADIRILERRENRAIQVVARWLAEGGKHIAYAKPGLVNDEHLPELHRFRNSSVFFYSETGSVIEANHVTWVRALVHNANPQIGIHYQNFADDRRGVVTIRPRYGCKLIALKEAASGAVEAVLELFTRLSPEDGEYCYAWDARLQSTARARGFARWQVVAPFATRADFHLIFHEKCTPKRAWWFNTSNDASAQIEPDQSEGRHLQLLHGGTYVYKVFVAEEFMPPAHLGIGYAWE
ncbi:hypothetical protein [Kibdelosporangium philippinense]